jgi:hypothetical protein
VLNSQQVRQYVIQPALKKINLYSEDAEELLIATMAHESECGAFIKQMEGPAVGVYQMEPRTYYDIWDSFLSKKPQLANDLLHACGVYEIPSADEMIWNMKYATIMARVFYLRVPQALPSKKDIDAIWLYYKAHWNTLLGKATKQDFLIDYYRFSVKMRSASPSLAIATPQ